MPNPKVVFQAIFQSAVRECERNTLVDLLQKKSPNSTTEAHKHAVLDSGPRTCATITDTNHLYLLFLNCCYFLDLTIKLTHMFSIISRYFLLIPSLMPSLWTANTPFIPPPPRFNDPNPPKQLITVPSYITTHRTDHAHIVTPWWGGGTAGDSGWRNGGHSFRDLIKQTCRIFFRKPLKEKYVVRRFPQAWLNHLNQNTLYQFLAFWGGFTSLILRW